MGCPSAGLPPSRCEQLGRRDSAMNSITRSHVGLVGTLLLAAGMAAFALAAPARGALQATVAHPHNWIAVPYVVRQLLHIGPSTAKCGAHYYCDDEVVHVGTLTITCKPRSNVTPRTPPTGGVRPVHPVAPAPCPAGFVPYVQAPGVARPILPIPTLSQTRARALAAARQLRASAARRLRHTRRCARRHAHIHGRLVAQHARSERQPPRPRGTNYGSGGLMKDRLFALGTGAAYEAAHPSLRRGVFRRPLHAARHSLPRAVLLYRRLYRAGAAGPRLAATGLAGKPRGDDRARAQHSHPSLPPALFR
jgi:hypothetical protein